MGERLIRPASKVTARKPRHAYPHRKASDYHDPAAIWIIIAIVVIAIMATLLVERARRRKAANRRISVCLILGICPLKA